MFAQPFSLRSKLQTVAVVPEMRQRQCQALTGESHEVCHTRVGDERNEVSAVLGGGAGIGQEAPS